MIGTMFFCLSFGIQVILRHIVLHASDLGISAINAANVLAITGLAGIAGRIILGIAGDRMGNKTIIIICSIMLSVNLFWLPFAKTVWALYLSATIFGFAYGGCDSPLSPLVAVLFGLRTHGLLIGILSTGFTLGAATGPYLAGYIFDVERNYQNAFLIFAIVAIIGLILALVLKPFRSPNSYQNSTLPQS